VIEKNN